ncbi:Ring finger protein [Aspergillus sclerotialis]|uniref:Ring finger protein n=1 Tax=Aspergillus sclerotialis TaxID=2070753 RepID=A0A3A2ZTL3_9EURO|nr:Ring finger protein [Aspergillus sclerotialis]
MVLSLPVPSFSRSNSTPLHSSDGNIPHRSPTGKYHAWKPILPSSSSNNSSTLSEALRNNPFGITSRYRPEVSAQQLQDQRREQEELNSALETLSRVFPDVKVEVFRELLVRFDGESRLQVCVEQLLRYKKEWVAGRWNVPDTGDGKGKFVPVGDDGGSLVPPEERFRSAEYKASVKAVLGREFGSLSKSTVDAVLAEVNFCYARARPTLRDLSRRTWRATFNSIFPSFKRKKDRDEHPLLQWHRQGNGEMVPRLKETGCKELDQELYDTLLEPLIRQRREEQEERDFQLAEELNEAEAKQVDALYECECCFMDMTFEQIATCSTNSHVICYNCIQRTLQEALFGQGWEKSVDTEKASLRCLAPLSHGSCEGNLHPDIVKQAVLLDKAGMETYRKFEDRLASDALLKSQLKLIRCPFCSYAEVDPVYHPSPRGVTWRFRRDGVLSTIFMILLLLDLIPLLIIPVTILLICNPTAIPAFLDTSFLNLCLKIRAKRFTCANTSCRRTSCITCQKPWRDPHVCHEPLLLDLRATVEAARTAAVKRTCPRCGLSFVKSSGCNKLTCVCGYSMCYLCRKALGPPIKPRPQQQPRPAPPRRRTAFFNQENANIMDGPLFNNPAAIEEDPEDEEPEGYSHFCEHFRVNPGSRCTECNKCDLYQAEDEEAVARRAGEKAEREWRVRQGMGGVAAGVGSQNVNHDFSVSQRKSSSWGWNFQSGKGWRYWAYDVWADGQWRFETQFLVDSVVERVVDVVEI